MTIFVIYNYYLDETIPNSIWQSKVHVMLKVPIYFLLI